MRTKHYFITLLTTLILLCGSFIGKALAGDDPDPYPGNPPPTPAWALKHWIWEDNGNTREHIENLVNGYLSRNIPVGAVTIDSPWSETYNDYIWDKDKYPNPQEMINNFHLQGIKVVMWTTGFINKACNDTPKNKHPYYDYVKEMGWAVDGGTDYTWWKGEGIHIDHTNPDAKEWWYSQMDQVLDMGIDGWKVDVGALYVSDPVNTYLGSISRQKFRKYYYADFYDYTISKNPNAIITARAYSSHQGGIGASITKNPICWQGDYRGDFIGLDNQKNDVYESALRGYGAPGVEVGGYYKEKPTKNSLIRYAQFGAMTPLMENGGRNGGLEEHLPWKWDTQTEDIYRYYAVLHNELVPYNFSYIVDCHENGGSVLKEVDKTKSHHKLGDQIFVSILTEDKTTKTVEFPKKDWWIDYWNEEDIYQGGTSIEEYDVPLEKFPIFIKAGAIIPLDVETDVCGHGDAASAGKITLLIYPAGLSDFRFHKPTGEGTAYEDINIDVDEIAGRISIDGTSTRNYLLRIKSFTEPASVTGADNWAYDTVKKVVLISKTGIDFTIRINGLQGYGPAQHPDNLVRLENYSGDSGFSDPVARLWDQTTQDGCNSYNFDPAWIEFSFPLKNITRARLWEDNMGNQVTSWRLITYNGTIEREAFTWTDTDKAGWHEMKFNIEADKVRFWFENNGPGSPWPAIHELQLFGSKINLISDLSVNDIENADSWSIRENLASSGEMQYGDRDYTIESIPSYLDNTDWIRTANDSKTYLDYPVATFTIKKDADIYIAHRDDIADKPDWLLQWTDTGDDLVNSEPETYSLWKRSFLKGSTVELGPNGGTGQGMYTVIVKETPTLPVSNLVVGLAPGGQGYVEVMQNAPPHSHIAWVRVPWPAYNAANGATFPAAGDSDGDNSDELFIGLGTYTTRGGYVEIRDDASAGFAHLAWPRVPWPAYNSANGATHPTCGDLDGDGRDEFFIGLGSYPANGGYIEYREDSVSGFSHQSWARVHWPVYNNSNGETRPGIK
jgi:hypothetical protein